MKRPLLRPPFAFALVTALFLAIALVWLVPVIPPRQRTGSTLNEIRIRILAAVRNTKVVPQNLESLPPKDGYSSRIDDAWGNRIKYEVRSDGVVVLTSFGKDGVAGGTGMDADIIGMFTIRPHRDGPMSGTDSGWIQSPWSNAGLGDNERLPTTTEGPTD